jgi:uncharacterized membrane protein YphA (DoxX/SURF4 family)
MDDSIAQPGNRVSGFDIPGWKTAINWIAAILIALLFLISGVWKITDAPSAAVRMAQARIPEALSLPAAIMFGIAETFSAVLVLVPRFRRWGAWLASLMLIAFLVYFGINYNVLRGEECNCFPWIKRVVGPGFFIGDVVMLVLAVLAGLWARQSESLRSAGIVLGVVVVFALVSYGAAATRQTGRRAPDSIVVDGKPFSLQQGKIFVYYFDPECMHCADAAKRMAAMNWGDTKVVAVAVQQKQFGQQFMDMTGLARKGVLSPDVELLRKTFPFVSAPMGVAIENGREKAELTQFEGEEPGATLKKLGFVY